MKVGQSIAAAGTAALLGVGLIAAAPSAYASTLQVDVADQVLAQTGIPTGYMVTGTGASNKSPITIVWGDGTAEVARGNCTVRKANTRPAKCRIRVGHVYTNPGVYSVQAQTSQGRVLDVGQVTVLGESIEKDPFIPKPTYTQSDQWRESMIIRINQVRAENGAGPVGACPRLDQIAQDYAQVMADTGHYDHTGPGGESPWDRMRAGGYEWRSAGENIARGQSDAGRVQQAWEDSEGHFRNMINPNLTHVGLGAAQSPSGRWVWVQKYGSGGNCDLGGRIVQTPAPVAVPR